MQRGRRLVVNRSRRRVEMMTARRAAPRLPLLRSPVALERSRLVALRAMRICTIRREARTPEMFQAGVIVGELAHEFHERAA